MNKSKYFIAGNLISHINKITFSMPKDNKKMIVFDTSLGSDNLGDDIIMYYCNKVVENIFCDYTTIHVSTHEVPDLKTEKEVKSTTFKIICGTNLLTSHIEQWWNWRLPDGLKGKLPYRNVILMGVGWGIYQDECSEYSAMIYKSLLNPLFVHSVRDQYTENKLRAIGIENVLNTGCPTMWNLTTEFCKEIPTKKAENVVTTVTDYRRDIDSDNKMLEILSRNYKHVYLWLQGRKDEEYLFELKLPQNVIIIPRELKAYEECLNGGNVDYVGTRLHAGIHALNHKVRSIIIAVDNRAIEISKDTNLPVIRREKINTELENLLRNDINTEIIINRENISRFKSQFLK